MNMKEILAQYLTEHDALGTRKDAVDKELFDQQHGQVWHNCDAGLQARKAELGAKNSLISEEEVELSELEMMFPTPLPARNLEAEIDELKAWRAKLERV